MPGPIDSRERTDEPLRAMVVEIDRAQLVIRRFAARSRSVSPQAPGELKAARQAIERYTHAVWCTGHLLNYLGSVRWLPGIRIIMRWVVRERAVEQRLLEAAADVQLEALDDALRRPEEPMTGV